MKRFCGHEIEEKDRGGGDTGERGGEGRRGGRDEVGGERRGIAAGGWRWEAGGEGIAGGEIEEAEGDKSIFVLAPVAAPRLLSV